MNTTTTTPEINTSEFAIQIEDLHKAYGDKRS